MNKKLFALPLAALLTLACNSAKPVAQNSAPVAANSAEKSQTAIAHNSSQAPPSDPGATTGGTTSHWKQSGDPIDTKEFDSAVAAAEVALKKDANNETLKKKTADAYFKRAMALTDARQYASALGDFRRTVKYDPSNSDATNWIEQIINIYNSMGREFPPEGQEPPPLTKGK